jgi:peptidoglycan/LPS O-acetylase OafA/YrhL
LRSGQKVMRVYLPAIDGLRFVAALFVIFNHFPAAEDTFVPLRFLKNFGWIGVDLFFVISTFLFTILLSEEDRRSGTIRIRYFYLRRCLRIMPLYYFYLIIILVAFTNPAWWNPTNFKRVAGLFLFVDNFISVRNGWNATPYAVHLWTISFEMQIYLIVPFAYLVLRHTSTGAILLVCATLAFFSLPLRFVFIEAGYKHPAIWVVHFLRPEAILAGTIIAFAMIRAHAWRLQIMIGGAFGLGVLLLMFVLGQQIGTYKYWQAYVYAASAAVMGALLWGACSKGPLNWFLSLPPMRYLGKISYGIYIYHLICIQGIVNLLGEPLDLWMWAAMLILAIALTVCVASVSYYLLERPFLRIKDRYELVPSRPI